MPTPTRPTSPTQMPREIRIGAIAYQVATVEELADGQLHGDINFGKCRIRIAADGDVQKQHVTLWHEVLHGILYQAGMTDQDEQTIDALAYGIVQVLRDNPKLHDA